MSELLIILNSLFSNYMMYILFMLRLLSFLIPVGVCVRALGTARVLVYVCQVKTGEIR